MTFPGPYQVWSPVWQIFYFHRKTSLWEGMVHCAYIITLNQIEVFISDLQQWLMLAWALHMWPSSSLAVTFPPFPSLPLEISKRNLHPPYLMPLKHLVRGHEKKNEKNHSRQVSREALMQAGRNGDLDGITTVILVGVHVS